MAKIRFAKIGFEKQLIISSVVQCSAAFINHVQGNSLCSGRLKFGIDAHARAKYAKDT